MKKSQDTGTQIFLDDISASDSARHGILQKLRDIVFGINPDIKERMMYGGIMFTSNSDFGGIFSYDKHVSFEFSNGYKFEDTNKVLEGKGKYRRHLKFRTSEDIETKNATYFIKQALADEK